MSAYTTYFLQKTKSSTNLQHLRLIKEVMHSTWYYKHHRCFLNLLSPIYYHSPNLNICCKTLPPYNLPYNCVTENSKQIVQKNFHYLVFQKGEKQVRTQVFLRGSNFFKKRYVFPPIYCQTQPSKGTLQNSCSAIVVKNP